MKIDVLKKVYNKELVGDDIDSVYEEALRSPDGIPWNDRLCLDRTEATAYMHGATFEEIAVWRYEGWPRKCCYCKRDLSLGQGGWKVVVDDPQSKIAHVECLPVSEVETDTD